MRSDVTNHPSVTDPNIIGYVIIGADKEVLNHSITVYNILDFLGDIGGLSDALKMIASFLVSVFC